MATVSKGRHGGAARRRHLGQLLKETYASWGRQKVPRLAAALAYYTAFSLAPLVIILLAVAALIFGRDAAQGHIFGPLAQLLGPTAAKGVQGMVSSAAKPSSSIAAAAVGSVMLVLGAAGLFGQLQDALNTVWEVAPKPRRGILGLLRDRFLSISMLLGTAFLLMVSLVASALLVGLGTGIGHLFPALNILVQILNVLLALTVITALFALIFKYLPDAEIRWRDVWVGAAATGAFFVAGQMALSVYLAKSSITSTYGAAASLLVVLLWVYYSTQLLLFGATFTKVYASQSGSRIRPSAGAVAVPAPEVQAGASTPKRARRS